MKILLLNTQMEAAGAQKALLTLAQGLKEAGYGVTVATMYDKADYIPLFRAQYGVDILDLQMKRADAYSQWSKIRAAAAGLYQLYSLMRSERFEVLQTFTHYSNIIGPIIAWLAGVPVRVTSQRNSLIGLPKWVLLCARLVDNSPLVDRITAVSEETRQFSIQVQHTEPNKVVTIYNGVDLNRYKCEEAFANRRQLCQALEIEETAVLILTIARLHPQKGHHHLLQAVPAIRQAVPQAHFLFVGEGKLEADLRRQIQADDLENCVHLLGVRQNIPELLSSSQLFVLPSLWEGLPNVLLEAMSAGLPVVATCVGGTPEIITDGHTGILIPPGDPIQLQNAIIQILQDPAFASTLSEAAKRHVAVHFSVEKNIAHYLALYAQLVAEKLK